MTVFHIDLPNIEIIDGTYKGSKYLVIAKAKGLKLAARFQATPMVRDEEGLPENVYVHAGARLRVVKDSDEGDVDAASEVFGIPHMIRRSEVHASALSGIPVCLVTDSPYSFRDRVLDARTLHIYAANVISIIQKQGITPEISDTILTEWLTTQMNEKIPALTPITAEYPTRTFFLDEQNAPSVFAKFAA